jgi:hypothetical protein
MLTPRPRHLLYLDATIGTIHTPHKVNQKHPITPQRDELKMAFVQPIIKWCRLITATTDGFTVAPWNHFYLDVSFSFAINKTYMIVHKRLEFVALV